MIKTAFLIAHFCSIFLTSILRIFFKFDTKKYRFSIAENWYCPWEIDINFNYCFSLIKKNTIISKRKLFDIYSISKQLNFRNQIWLEIGTFRGGSAGLLFSNISGGRGGELILWDNWSDRIKLPSNKIYSIEADLQSTKELMNKISFLYTNSTLKKIVYIDKKFPDPYFINRFTYLNLVHFDIYSHKAFLSCFMSLWPLIKPGGIFIVSAYGSISLNKLTEAVNSTVKRYPNCFFFQTQSGLAILQKKI